MGRSDKEVIALFNEQVNMTADELEKWLEDPQSRDAGTGVGIESGRRIVEILRKNPTKSPDAYDEEDIAHIRKVVGYNSRHLAQEDHLRETKTTAQLAKAKSTISLKNWGHDPVKVKLRESGTSSKNDTAHGNSNSISGGGDGVGDDGASEADNCNATSPDNERDRDHQGRQDRDSVHDSEEDADGDVDTAQVSKEARTVSPDSGDDSGSDSDPFEDTEIGRKRPPRGPPAGIGAERRRRERKRGHASGEGGHGTVSGRGAGQNKRLHTDTDERPGPEQGSS